MQITGLTVALILLLGFACQWLAWRIRLPAILFLLLSGIVVGPVTGLVDPDALLGDLLFPVISLGVAVILFEGSLTLRFEETGGVHRIIRNLITVGVVVTMIGMAVAGHYVGGLSWPLSFLFGALVSVTGPTVIMPLIRSVRPTSRIANILRWEGILVDPVGAILAVLVFDAIVSGRQNDPLIAFGLLVLVGVVAGLVGAVILAQLLKRHLIPEYLQNYAALALVLLVFTASNAIEHESGLLAVTIMGVVLANVRDLHVEDILDFKEHLTLLLLSLLFILLGARVDLNLMGELWIACVVILLIAKLVVRPLAVAASSIGTSVTFREGMLLAWIGPRGIVAAAVAALFALKLEEAGFPQAEHLIPFVFAVIIGTVLIESATAKWVARRLDLSAADDQGVLIVGANQVGLALAEALKDAEYPAILADNNYEAVRRARMRGFKTYYGSVLSEHADRHLDMTGVNRLFAVTRNPELNTLICSRYKPDFGIRRTFMLLMSKERDEQRSHRQLATGLRVPLLFGEHVSWSQLASQLAKGGDIRSTQLTESFDMEDYRERYGSRFILLFATGPQGKLHVFSSMHPIDVGPGWTLISLIKPEESGKTTGESPAVSEAGDTSEESASDDSTGGLAENPTAT